MEAAAQSDEGLAAAAQEPPAIASFQKDGGRIVTGPVLIDQPPLPDADALDTGTVVLSVRTDSAGRVLSAGVRRSSGSARLDSLAVRQMRQSRFQAAVKKNRHVASSFEYPFRFQKKQAGTQEQQDQEEKPTQQERPDKQEQPKQQQPKDEHKLQDQKSQPAQDDKSDTQEDDSSGKPPRQKR